jgi:hypothetical protein
MVSADSAGVFIGWHEIAIKRARDLLPPAAASKQIGAFFHKKVPNLAPCCLLNQVATHCLQGLSAASRRTTAGLKPPVTVPGGAEVAHRGRLPPALVAEAAEACMESGPRATFAAVSSCEQIVRAMQQHFNNNMLPHLTEVCLGYVFCDLGEVWLVVMTAEECMESGPRSTDAAVSSCKSM